MSKIKRTPGTALERGKFIETCSDPASLAHHAENRDLVADMYRRYRFEWVMELALNEATGKYEPAKPTDEWVIVGQRGGMAFEQGVNRLGVTIVGSRRIAPLVRSSQSNAGFWLHPYQVGDEEANFWCEWTEENVRKVHEMVKFIVRRKNPSAKPPPRPTPAVSVGILK
jgi:hypothetical protein